MMNDFLPAIVTIGILAAAFLFAWVSDVRSDVAEEASAGATSLVQAEDAELS